MSPAIRRALGDVFGLDTRALAVFRIALGFTILIDLLVRAQDLGAHYTDGGAFPRTLMIDTATTTRFSVYLAAGSWDAVASLFAVQALVAVALIVGWRTRWMTGISWALAVSLQMRNPLVINAGDVLLRMLLLWGIFLPLGAAWSVDARSRLRPAATRVLNVYTVALVVQVTAVYITTVLFKTGEPWWDGTAVYRVVHLDLFARPLGVWARDQAWLTTSATWFTILYEMLGIALVLSPVWTARLRTIGIAGFFALHLGFALFINVGMFPLVSIVSWLPLIPAATLDRMTRTATASRWRQRPPALMSALGAALLVYMVLILVRPLTPIGTKLMPMAWMGPAQAIGLDQKWDMFAPSPPSVDGWYLFEGATESGQLVNLYNPGLEASLERPEHVLQTVGNRRWGKVFSRLREDRNKQYQAPLCMWMVHRYNRSHREDPLASMRWVFMVKPKVYATTAREKVIWKGNFTKEPFFR